MVAVVGVHGIAQQQSGAHQLEEVWSPALADGLEAATGQRWDPPPGLQVAFYGGLFLPEPEPEPARFKAVAGDPDLDLLADLSADELDDLAGAVAEIVPAGALGDGAVRKGMRGPRDLLADMAAALDRKFGAAAGVLMLGELRQVRRYLCDPVITAGAEDAVSRTVTAETRVLVGHSLGSVVAWQWARKNPQVQLDLLLTLGSPLGLQMVRSRINPPVGGDDPGLGHVARWVNVYDSSDVVACACPLQPIWSIVTDHQVDNGNKPHAIDRYLGKRQTGEAIAQALRVS